MAIKKILVPVVGANRDADALGSAFVIAKAFDGHVSALFVKPDPTQSLLYFDPNMPTPPDIIESTINVMRDAAQNASRIAHMHFEKAARIADAPLISHPAKGDGFSCSFAQTQGFFHERVSALAAFSDLVVFGSVSEKESFEIGEGFIETLRRSERPVLIAPTAMTKMPAKVAIGWDGSASAMRAISSSIPLLAAARKIEVFMVRRPGEHTSYLSQMKDYLLLHDVVCVERVVDPGSNSIGEALMESATASDCDLLVMGGYGQHGYWREALFGGVTSHARSHAKLPILMLH